MEARQSSMELPVHADDLAESFAAKGLVDHTVGVDCEEELRARQPRGASLCHSVSPQLREVFPRLHSGSCGEGTEAVQGAESVDQPCAGVNEVLLRLVAGLLPEAELAGEAHLGSPVEAPGCVDLDGRIVTQHRIDASQGIDKGDVFEGTDGRHTSGLSVNLWSAGERGAEVFEMPGPGVAGVRVVEVFQFSDLPLVETILEVGGASSVGKGVEVSVFQSDHPANGVGALQSA